jgi:dolichyl-diphosphooligosaccharide--protein glycosyltransferase
MSVDGPDVYRETTAFLETHVEGVRIVDAALAVDAAHDRWTFDDIDVDSGQFGELASTALVERVDRGYRLRDAEAVRAARNGEDRPAATNDWRTRLRKLMTLDRPFLTPGVGGLLASLFVVFVVRIANFSTVYQSGRVVSPGNDPYFYRYWQERLVAETTGPLSFGVLVDPPWQTGDWNQRPLTHATNWWLTELLGGSQWAAEFVAAWQPVVFTLLLAVLLYRTVIVLADDERIGVLAVLVLGLAPIHVGYTGLGLFHHRSHQFLWFGLALYALVRLARDLADRRERVGARQAVRDRLTVLSTWKLSALFGVALGLYTHSWGGSAEVFLPLVGYLGLRSLLAIDSGVSPGRSLLPLVAGTGVGGTIAVTLHLLLGWHGQLAPAVALLAVLVSIGLLLSGELWHRQSRSASHLFLSQIGLGILALAVVFALRPGFANLVADSFGRALLAPGRSSQSASLLTPELGVFGGPLFHIGLSFYAGLAGLGWGVMRARKRFAPAWLAFVVFGFYYLVAASVLLRFAARLVIVLAPFAGLGILTVLAKVELARTPQPLASRDGASPRRSIEIPSDSKRIAYVCGILVVVFALNVVLSPTVSGRMLYDRAEVDTAQVLGDHASEHDLDYPESYVFAPWGQDRMYNYFVSGNSRSETYARGGYGDRGYSSFIRASQPDHIVSKLSLEEWNVFEDDLGYLVVRKQSASFANDTVQSRLYGDWGRRTARFDALAHYRLLHVSTGESVLAFQIVPGANLTVSGEPNKTITVATDVTVEGASFTYERSVWTGPDGTGTIVIPYAGTYRIHDETVFVSDTDVMESRSVSVTLQSGQSASINRTTFDGTWAVEKVLIPDLRTDEQVLDSYSGHVS